MPGSKKIYTETRDLYYVCNYRFGGHKVASG